MEIKISHPLIRMAYSRNGNLIYVLNGGADGTRTRALWLDRPAL